VSYAKPQLKTDPPSSLSPYISYIKDYYQKTGGSLPEKVGYSPFKTEYGEDIKLPYDGKSLGLVFTCQASTGCENYSFEVHKESFSIKDAEQNTVLTLDTLDDSGFYHKFIDSYVNDFSSSDITSAPSTVFTPQTIKVDQNVGYEKSIVTVFLNVEALQDANTKLNMRTPQNGTQSLVHPISEKIYNTAGTTFSLSSKFPYSFSGSSTGDVSLAYTEQHGETDTVSRSLTHELGASFTYAPSFQILGTGASGPSATMSYKVSMMTSDTTSRDSSTSETKTLTVHVPGNSSGVAFIYQIYRAIGVDAGQSLNSFLENINQITNSDTNHKIALGLGGITTTSDGKHLGTVFPFEKSGLITSGSISFDN